MMRTKTLKSRIKLTEAALVKLKERYERKSRELLAMKKELQTAKLPKSCRLSEKAVEAMRNL